MCQCVYNRRFRLRAHMAVCRKHSFNVYRHCHSHRPETMRRQIPLEPSEATSVISARACGSHKKQQPVSPSRLLFFDHNGRKAAAHALLVISFTLYLLLYHRRFRAAAFGPSLLKALLSLLRQNVPS